MCCLGNELSVEISQALFAPHKNQIWFSDLGFINVSLHCHVASNEICSVCSDSVSGVSTWVAIVMK